MRNRLLVINSPLPPNFGSGVSLGVFLLLGVLFAGCASSGTTSQTAPMTNRTWTGTEAESRLQAAAERWEGVPHQLGGTTPRGVDCSGLVQSVFANEFHHSLPRTTDEQVHAGTKISRSRLRPGDLVFFRPGWKKRHVGIYMSEGTFLHASSSDGVRVSSLNRSYWNEHWWQARRVLSAPEADSTITRTNSPPPRASQGMSW